jgi:hypothetical protein
LRAIGKFCGHQIPSPTNLRPVRKPRTSRPLLMPSRIARCDLFRLSTAHGPCAPAVPLLSHEEASVHGTPNLLGNRYNSVLGLMPRCIIWSVPPSRETLIPEHDSYPHRYHASRRSCRPVTRGAGAAQEGLDPQISTGLRNFHGSPDDCSLCD